MTLYFSIGVWTRRPVVGAARSIPRYPMAFVFERGGRSIAGPAILHTSTNTPAIILALPEELMAAALVMHMGVILVSAYLVLLVAAPAHRARPQGGVQMRG
jgi:hypothetical protein